MRHSLALLHCVPTTLLLALLAILGAPASTMATATELRDTTLEYGLDSSVDVLFDSLGNKSIEQVISEHSNSFVPSTGLKFGYTQRTIWLRVNLKKSTPSDAWYLEIPAPYVEYVDFYQKISDGSWQHSIAGYYRKQSEKPFPHTGHVLPLTFDNNGMATVYIRVSGKGPKTFPLYAIHQGTFFEKVRIEDLCYGMFYGILIVMFFYNLLLYFTLKELNYLLYILTIVCTFVIFLSASGYGGKFIWPESPQVNFYAGRMSMGILIIFFAIFMLRFLDVKRYSKVTYYVVLMLIPLGVLSNILVATDVMPSAGNNLISLATVLFMLAGIVCRMKGNKTATYFIAAWSFYFTGGLLLTLRNSGVFEFNFWTTHFVEIGGALQTVIIAFALGDQYRRFKTEKEAAQALALRVQQEATEELEIKVMVRTEQLSKAYEELHQTLEKNKEQTKIIENKNAELDTFFHRISHDLRGPISSLLGLSFLARIDIKDPIALDYIDKQHQQVDRLNHIISGLINLTKLSNGDLDKQKIDFHQLLDDCITSFNGLENFSRVTFTKKIDEELEFYSEWTLLNAIVQNLIENAIKYSTANSPVVNILVEGMEESIILTVQDNGQGIPEHHQPRIFEMFFRATRNSTGTGLGLYILKRSVDRLNGSIDFQSKVGVGSTFRIHLPRN